MPDTLVKTVRLNIFTDPGTAQEKLDALDLRAKELKATLDKPMQVRLDTALAMTKAKILQEELKKTSTIAQQVGGPKGILDRVLFGSLGRSGGGGGGLLGGFGRAGNLFGGSGSGSAAADIESVAGGGASAAGGLGPGALLGIGAAVPALSALLVEAAGLASGFAAAAAGVGAFGLVAIPTFKQLQQDATSLQGAWEKLQTTQNKLIVAQQNFNADPTKANKAALAAAEKAVVTAQTNLKAAQMGLGQDAGPAAAGVLKLRDAYSQLTAAIQPQAFKVLNTALKVANTLLPDLKPFAQAGATAIDNLLGKALKFFQSADFKKWLASFEKIVGPAIEAIGTGIGKVTISVGKLFTLMSSHDVVHAINIVFDTIAGIINVVDGVISRLMSNWDRMIGSIKAGVDWVNRNLFSLGGSGTSTTAGRKMASGGYAAGGFTLVGEQGPELADLPAGTHVYSASMTRAMLAGSGGGGNTYNITVSVPPSVNPAEIGRQVVTVIRAYEQRSGKSWRS